MGGIIVVSLLCLCCVFVQSLMLIASHYLSLELVICWGYGNFQGEEELQWKRAGSDLEEQLG